MLSLNINIAVMECYFYGTTQEQHGKGQQRSQIHRIWVAYNYGWHKVESRLGHVEVRLWCLMGLWGCKGLWLVLGGGSGFKIQNPLRRSSCPNLVLKFVALGGAHHARSVFNSKRQNCMLFWFLCFFFMFVFCWYELMLVGSQIWFQISISISIWFDAWEDDKWCSPWSWGRSMALLTVCVWRMPWYGFKIQNP